MMSGVQNIAEIASVNAGTEVAKEAADIVIMDDNFRSIVKSVLWGRSVFENIRKFLQFQMTVNFVALILAFVAAVSNGEQPLNVLQLLWVNLIMDALAALGQSSPPLCLLVALFTHGISAEVLHESCCAAHVLFCYAMGLPLRQKSAEALH